MSLLSCFLDVSSLNLAALRRRLFFALPRRHCDPGECRGKQSIFVSAKEDGLLRRCAPRNDVHFVMIRHIQVIADLATKRTFFGNGPSKLVFFKLARLTPLDILACHLDCSGLGAALLSFNTAVWFSMTDRLNSSHVVIGGPQVLLPNSHI